jgi:hypothetical protein
MVSVLSSCRDGFWCWAGGRDYHEEQLKVIEAEYAGLKQS